MDEVSLLASRVHVLDAARNLGVIFDSKLSMSAQISVVCRTGYCQLRQLRTFVRCLSEDATKILIQALINTWLDYCNSLYFGIADGLMSRLQSVQNAAARLITGARQCEHITPALRQLHWLPVRRRVDFKISALVYRSLAGTAPVYLADECTLVTALAAVLCGLLTIEQSNLVKRSHNQFGDRCFATAGERCGTVCLNSFGNRTSPSDNSNDRWKRLCLVSWAATPCLWMSRAPTINLFTYLLTYTNWHPSSYLFEVIADYCSNLVQKTATLRY